MGRLQARFSPTFQRDLKRLEKRHVDDAPLAEAIDLIIENTPEALEELRRRHRMHTLSGNWRGSNECHVCNAGDWLLVWCVSGDIAVMQRTGTHDEIFR